MLLKDFLSCVAFLTQQPNFHNVFCYYFYLFKKKEVKEVLVCWQQNIDAYFDGMSFLKGYVVMLKNQNAS